jgi:hypothetical protein
VSWEGFCITCKRMVELAKAPADGVLPDCPVCSAPIVVLAEEEEVLWVVEA